MTRIPTGKRRNFQIFFFLGGGRGEPLETTLPNSLSERSLFIPGLACSSFQGMNFLQKELNRAFMVTTHNDTESYHGLILVNPFNKTFNTLINNLIYTII